jgi:hypothetical protein
MFPQIPEDCNIVDHHTRGGKLEGHRLKIDGLYLTMRDVNIAYLGVPDSCLAQGTFIVLYGADKLDSHYLNFEKLFIWFYVMSGRTGIELYFLLYMIGCRIFYSTL